MSQTDDFDWEPTRLLGRRVEEGEPLTLTAEVVTMLRLTAREVAISAEDVERALQTVESATELLREMVRRIDDGGDRIGPALHRMYQLRDSGDLEGARQQMRDVLAVEVVPHYRRIAQGQLEQLDDWEKEKAGKR